MEASVKTAEAAGACITLAGKQITCIEKSAVPAVLMSGQNKGHSTTALNGTGLHWMALLIKYSNEGKLYKFLVNPVLWQLNKIKDQACLPYK